VPAVAGRYDDGVDVNTCDQFPEVVAGGAAAVAALAARGGVGVLDHRPGVVAAPAIDVADGDHLNIGAVEEDPQVPLSHAADADEAERDPLARRGRAAPPERARFHDRRRGGSHARGRRRAEKAPARDAGVCESHESSSSEF
jgi:hypothetical protein